MFDALAIRAGRVSAPLRLDGPSPRVGDYVLARDQWSNELHHVQVEAVGPSHVRLVLL